MDARYAGREQTEAKHRTLEHYLKKLAYKIGFTQSGVTLNYIDAFAGPWESKSDDLSDTSPAIALKTLLGVRDDLARHGKPISVRAFFVSPTTNGVEQLEALRTRFKNAEIEVATSRFENAVEAALRFARGGSNPFTFVFIDPTGWTGFGLRDIAPLLRQKPNEVLINFMTEHIKRFADDNDASYSSSIVDLYGDDACRNEWRGLSGLDREERMVETYAHRIAQTGDYRHCVSSVILKPTEDRTYFHLVYGTRSDEGLVTFREVGRDVLKVQRTNRADAKQRKRVARTGSFELFNAMEIQAPLTYEDTLRKRYLARAHTELKAATPATVGVPWDTLVLLALRIPMIAEPDVKDWLKEQVDLGLVEVIGLKPKERVPKRGGDHLIRRL